MTSRTQHRLSMAPGHRGPVPCAWNLSPRFVSLFGPFSYVYFLLHLCLYVTYLFMIWFPLCLFVSLCPYIPALIPDWFVLPLSSWPAYISLVCHVCLLSSYIDFNLTITVNLCLHVTWVFCLTVFLASGNCSTLVTLLFNFTHYWKPSRHILQLYNFPVTHGMHIYLHISEIPGPQQKAGAAHELKPLSIPPVTSRNLRDPAYCRVPALGGDGRHICIWVAQGIVENKRSLAFNW